MTALRVRMTALDDRQNGRVHAMIEMPRSRTAAVIDGVPLMIGKLPFPPVTTITGREKSP